MGTGAPFRKPGSSSEGTRSEKWYSIDIPLEAWLTVRTSSFHRWHVKRPSNTLVRRPGFDKFRNNHHGAYFQCFKLSSRNQRLLSRHRILARSCPGKYICTRVRWSCVSLTTIYNRCQVMSLLTVHIHDMVV